MARPKIEIDQHQCEELCRLKPTLRDCAAFFKCSEDTIERRAKEWGYDSFADMRDKSMVHTRLSLIRKAISAAMNGNNTMHIFCLKNLCGWSDKLESKEVKEVSIHIDGDDTGL